MKKLTALLLSALLCLSLLAGCQQGAEETKNPTCEEVLTAIQEAIGEDNLPMMGEIDDETLSVLYGFEPTELLEDYRGSISQMNVHADEILVMKVKEGNMEDVEAGVAQRQEDVYKRQSYTHAVTAMYALGCLQGTDGAGTFGGSENMDRAAACTVLARLLATVDGSASQPEPEPDPQDELDALRQEMLERVNEERAKVGAPALVLDETLCEAAQLRAQETAENYSHTRPDGSSVSYTHLVREYAKL